MERNLTSQSVCMQMNILRFERFTLINRGIIMALKPGPKPIAKPDQRRRDNKKTPGNTPGLKPSKSSSK